MSNGVRRPESAGYLGSGQGGVPEDPGGGSGAGWSWSTEAESGCHGSPGVEPDSGCGSSAQPASARVAASAQPAAAACSFIEIYLRILKPPMNGSGTHLPRAALMMPMTISTSTPSQTKPQIRLMMPNPPAGRIM